MGIEQASVRSTDVERSEETREGEDQVSAVNVTPAVRGVEWSGED